MLKVGDRVRALCDDVAISKGCEYVIVAVDESDSKVPIRVLDDDGDYWWMGFDQYEIVPVAEATGTDVREESAEPKFKVGDRVRNPDVPDAGVGIIEEIKPEGGYSVNYKDTWFGVCHDTDDMLVPAGITIQPGKCYRTRDGRKVGPMQIYGIDLFKVPGDIDGRLWWADGDRYSRNNDHDDLIAEWVGEPSEVFDELERWMADNPQPANDNSTAGFTIPFEEEEPDTTLRIKFTSDFSELDAEIDRVKRRLKKLAKKARKLGISLEYDDGGLEDADSWRAA